ncbi:hypothetical protein COOONC_16513 [Cooperia oncophora]
MRLQIQVGIECIVIPCDEDELVHTVALRTVAKMRKLRPAMVKPAGGKEYEEIRRTVGNSLVDPEDRVGDVLKDGDFVILGKLYWHRDETEEEKERRRQVELESTRVALEKLDKPKKVRIKFEFDPSPEVPLVDKPTNCLLVLDGQSLTPADLVLCEKGECALQLSIEAEEKIKKGRALLEKIASEHCAVYGVTTGFGIFSNVRIADDQLK